MSMVVVTLMGAGLLACSAFLSNGWAITVMSIGLMLIIAGCIIGSRRPLAKLPKRRRVLTRRNP